MNNVNITILGLGTVGVGVVNILQRNQQLIQQRTGCQITICAAAVNDIAKVRACNTEQIQITDDAASVLARADIVVELIGGITIAYDLVMQALQQGKHVVTANKALIAEHGQSLLNCANDNKVMLEFEAAVAGGIPIVKALRESYIANEMLEIKGIINGTTNYILSKMHKQAWSFADALREAQQLGFAEADPTFDIEGTDAAHKLAIMAALVFNMPLPLVDFYCEGITKIAQQDIQYASELGYVVKHLAIAKVAHQNIELRVHPALVAKKSTLAHIDDAMNAVQVTGDAVGKSLLSGVGAGAEPTASAVVADIAAIAKRAFVDKVSSASCQPSPIQRTIIDNFESANYLRLQLIDKPGVLATISQILGEHSISIHSILQQQAAKHDGQVPVVIVTQPVLEQRMQQAVVAIQALFAVSDDLIRIRLES